MLNDEYICKLVSYGNGQYEYEPTGRELVRCKDCVDWDLNYTNRAKPDVHPCRGIGHATTGNFFCGFGERKDEVENG